MFTGDAAENFEAADRPKSVDIADETEPTDRKRRSADKELLPRLNINGALGGAANMLNATGLVDGLQDKLNLLGGLIGNNRGTPIKM